MFVSENNELLKLIEGYFIFVHILPTLIGKEKKLTFKDLNFLLEFRLELSFPGDLKQESASFQRKV